MRATRKAAVASYLNHPHAVGMMAVQADMRLM